MKKTILLLFLFGIIGFSYSSVGVGISPAIEKYNISMDGGKILITVYNGGTEDANFIISLSGELANISSVQKEVVVHANEYKQIPIYINPQKWVEPNKYYSLIVSARNVPKGKIGIGASVSGRYNIMFYGNRTKPWNETIKPIESKPQNIVNETNAKNVKFGNQTYIYLLIGIAIGVGGGIVWAKRTNKI